MTNAPPSRKTHITRILGTNKAGERLDDIWVDVERMDIVKGSMQIPPNFQWQGFQRKFRWSDNPDEDGYSPDGTPSRLTTVIKVCDPQSQNVDDPDEWVPVRIIRGLKASGGGSESMGQAFVDRFANDELNAARVAQVRRIPHYDTTIDDDATAAFADPARTEYVVDGVFYTKIDATKDDGQYVEHEIIKYLKPKTDSLAVMGQGRQTRLLNEYLISESDNPDFAVLGASGINPPYRLDPFQNIVNVQFGQTVIVVMLLNSRPFATQTIIEQNAEFLENFGGDMGGGFGVDATAYKVDANAGEFLRTKLANTAIVFAISGGDMDASLKRAKAGAGKIWSAIVEMSAGSFPDGLTPKIDPPGMLWVATLPTFPDDGQVVTWKMRNGPHRRPGSASPPNRMVQCYPSAARSYVEVGFTISGWAPCCYRLDRSGTGPSYGIDWSSPDLTKVMTKTTLMDAAWLQTISSPTTYRGVPFGIDPPPLVGSDTPSVGT